MQCCLTQQSRILAIKSEYHVQAYSCISQSENSSAERRGVYSELPHPSWACGISLHNTHMMAGPIRQFYTNGVKKKTCWTMSQYGTRVLEIRTHVAFTHLDIREMNAISSWFSSSA